MGSGLLSALASSQTPLRGRAAAVRPPLAPLRPSAPRHPRRRPNEAAEEERAEKERALLLPRR